MGSTSGGSNWGAPNPGTGYYRGGSDLTPRVGVDVRVDKQTGELRPGRGISLFDDPDHPKLQRFDEVHEVVSYPKDLTIQQQGQDSHHHELAPAQPMSFERFVSLIEQVVLRRIR
jgi:DNA segregation ATPase FtsK/SpoIIIE-like protein